MNQGAEVDMVTGRPAAEVKNELASKAIREEENRLKDLASFVSLMDSEEGMALSAIVWKKFINRAQQIIGEDPECSAYMNVLKDFGVKIKMAEAAAEELAKKAMKKEPG